MNIYIKLDAANGSCAAENGGDVPGQAEKSARRCCGSSSEFNDAEPGTLKIEDDEGVDVNGRYVTGAQGLAQDDVVVLFALSPATAEASADGLVGSNMDLYELKMAE